MIPSLDKKQQRDKINLETVLQNRCGKEFVLRLLDECGVYRNAYSGEADATMFRLGEQNVGLKIIGMINDVDPSLYPKMMIEAAQTPKEQEVVILNDE